MMGGVRGRLPRDECYPAGHAELAQHVVTLAGGERLRVVVGGPLEAVPVLLVHGWACSSYFFRKLTPALLAAGYRVIAPDLRGHGWSDKPKDKRLYTQQAMADQLRDLMTALRLDRPHIVSHSLGGGVTLDAAAQAGSAFRSITLLAPVGLADLRLIPLARLFTPPVAAPLVPYMIPRWTVPFVLRAAYGQVGTYSMRDVEEYWAPTADPNFALALRALLHEFNFRARPPSQLSRIQCPVLIILGGRDLLVRLRQSVEAAVAIPRARVVQFERAGHILAEEIPGEILAELLPHLEAAI